MRTPTPGIPRASTVDWLKRSVAARVVLFACVGLLLVAAMTGRIDMASVHRVSARLNGAAAFSLLVVLPLVGFPASVLHLAAGIRFGAVLGQALVSLSILIQLLASYGLVHAWRGGFARRFDGLRRRIPSGAHPTLCILAVLIPGAPYTAINYVLPLIGVRLRTFLLCCWPLHTLRSTVTVLLGDQTDKLTPARLSLLAGYALLLSAGSWWMYRRLRRQLGDPPPTGDDPTQRA
jgi:uncharacterized membrane protein YdjX (TVP38/TMEM64 family)